MEKGFYVVAKHGRAFGPVQLALENWVEFSSDIMAFHSLILIAANNKIESMDEAMDKYGVISLPSGLTTTQVNAAIDKFNSDARNTPCNCVFCRQDTESQEEKYKLDKYIDMIVNASNEILEKVKNDKR